MIGCGIKPKMQCVGLLPRGKLNNPATLNGPLGLYSTPPAYCNPFLDPEDCGLPSGCAVDNGIIGCYPGPIGTGLTYPGIPPAAASGLPAGQPPLERVAQSFGV